MGQEIWSGGDWPDRLSAYLSAKGAKKLLLVCGRSYDGLCVRGKIEALPVERVRFSDFSPNPLYEDVCRGVERFRTEQCDAILAVGGGSAVDVAKCVKLYCKMDPARNYLEQDPADTGVPLIAMPTTAGTGSESTRFAVIYKDGVKQSVTHESIRPDVAVLEPAVLEKLPPYQRKCTMLDALCQGIESWWSVNSTQESKQYAHRAVRGIMENMNAYLAGDSGAAREIMLAANFAGQAINITQTTAPHAMSYKLTSLYKLPHGHAVAACLPEVWAYMLTHPENCVDRRGAGYLADTFADIARALGQDSPEAAVSALRELLAELGIAYPASRTREQDLETLAGSVNPTRLKNNPVALDTQTLRGLYERILKDEA